MNSLLFESLYILVLAGFLGYEVIRKVPPLLHTPLMSITNAISGISLVGSLIAAGSGQSTVSTVLGTIAVTAATINVVSTVSRFGFTNPDTFVRAAPLLTAFLVFLLPSRRLQDWVRSLRAGRLGHTPLDQR